MKLQTSRYAKKVIFLTMLACVRCSARGHTPAQQPKHLQVEDALSEVRFSQLMPIVLSPDDKWVAYSAKDNRRSKNGVEEEYQRTGVPDVGVGADICVSNTETL